MHLKEENKKVERLSRKKAFLCLKLIECFKE